MVWDKDSVIGKAKAACAGKAKQGINSLLPISRQVCSHLQESNAPSHIVVTWENKCYHSECSLPFFCPPTLYTEQKVIYGMEYPFGPLGSAVPAMSPHNFLCTPSLTAGGVGWEAGKALTLCTNCSAEKKHPCAINTVFSTNPKKT